MGWNHHTHNNLRDAANYIGLEHNRQDLRLLFQSLEALHHNYYEHQREVIEVQDGIDGAEVYIRGNGELPARRAANQARPSFPIRSSGAGSPSEEAHRQDQVFPRRCRW